MRKCFYLVITFGVVAIIDVTNVDANAQSSSPQMALMFVRYKAEDQFDTYISIVQTINDKLKEIDHRILDRVYWDAAWSPKAKALLFYNPRLDDKSELIIRRADGSSTTLNYK